MIVKAVFTHGSELRSEVGNSDLAAGRGLFFTDETVFHVKHSALYPVFGIGMTNFGLVLLIVDETGLPRWLPIDLFTVEDATIPNRWQFRYFGHGGETTWQARWGYPMLVHSEEHCDALAEGRPDALATFEHERATRLAELNWGPS